MGPSTAVVIVPARYDSRRLPGKALADLQGRPVVVRVMEQVRRATRVQRAFVATDDERIFEAVSSAGHAALMTSRDHASGTDRVAEAACRLGLADDTVVVDVQGDEPLVDPATIDRVVEVAVETTADVVTVSAPLEPDEADNPARVKVTTDRNGRALYFSRSPIPHGGPWRVHLGLYAFRMRALQRFTALEPGALERSERLEQLRFIEHGMLIHLVEVDVASPSLDTPDDLARVRRLFRGR